jgi:hypothetical protein
MKRRAGVVLEHRDRAGGVVGEGLGDGLAIVERVHHRVGVLGSRRWVAGSPGSWSMVWDCGFRSVLPGVDGRW